MSDDNAGKLTRLEEEGELAADYLEELLDIADLDGDIEIDVENGRASVEIVADEGLTSESEGVEPHRRVVILPEESDGE